MCVCWVNPEKILWPAGIKDTRRLMCEGLFPFPQLLKGSTASNPLPHLNTPLCVSTGNPVGVRAPGSAWPQPPSSGKSRTAGWRLFLTSGSTWFVSCLSTLCGQAASLRDPGQFYSTQNRFLNSGVCRSLAIKL